MRPVREGEERRWTRLAPCSHNDRQIAEGDGPLSMIRKSGNWFSEKIMRKQELERDLAIQPKITPL
jgi:hypothetical protein